MHRLVSGLKNLVTKLSSNPLTLLRMKKFWATALVASFLAVSSQAAQTLAADPILNPQDFEKDFLKIWDPAQNIWTDPVNLSALPGDGKVIFRNYYHNGMPETTAFNTKVKAILPSGFANSHEISADIWADNAGRVIDKAKLGLPGDYELEYVPGSTKQWRWEDNQDQNQPPVFINLPDGITSSQGVEIGDIPGCWDFYGYVYFKARLIAPAPGLGLLKSVDKAQASIGETLNYTLNYENKGNITLTSTVLDDTLPSQVTFVSANPLATSQDGQTLTWNIGDLGAQSSQAITIQAKVKTELQPGTHNLINNAKIDAAEVDPVIAMASTTVTVIQPNPQISLTKTVDKSQASAGDTLYYTVKFKNTGNITLTKTVVTDALPAEVDFVSANPAQSSKTGQTLSWNISDLPSNTERTIVLTAKVKSDLLPGDYTLVNKTTIDAEEINPITASATTLVHVQPLAKPAASISKTVDRNTADPGNQLTYKIIFQNTGNVKLTGTVITDDLPSQTIFVSVNPAQNVKDGNRLTWNIGDLQVGEKREITLVARVKKDLTIGKHELKNVAKIDTKEIDPLEATAQTTVFVTPIADPADAFLEKKVSKDTASAGDRLTYTLTYRNLGDEPMTGTVLRDFLPEKVKFIKADPAPTKIDGQTLIWEIGRVDPPLSHTVTVEVEVKRDLEVGTHALINNAKITSKESSAEDSATTFVTVFLPPQALAEMAKFVRNISRGETNFSPQNFAVAGDVLEYKIWMVNSGKQTLNTVQFLDVLPLGTTMVPGTLKITQGGKDIEIATDPTSDFVTVLENLTVRDTITVFLQVKISPSVAVQSHLINAAHFKAENLEPLSATASTIVEEVKVTPGVQPVITVPAVPSAPEALAEIKGPATLPKTGSEGLWISLAMFTISSLGYLYQRSKKQLALASLEYKLS